ncbi:MAG: hypothetical protein A3K09_04665 [Nitrospinae bacterium RIFCSPLOWO2_12_FULL_47_7]|nr:MAG: hypothetical protein A3K09_04665 [Nitrospinae bacterium RIFCSPLOWO2_12_FULL_47_7]
MNLSGKKILGVKVINIIEEDAKAIEKMVNDAVKKIDTDGKQILDIQITEDNIFLILGQNT